MLTRAAGCCRRRCIIFHGAPGTTYVVLGRVKNRRRGILSVTGVYWRYDLTAQDKSRVCGSSKSVRGVGDLSIHVLELLSMVVSAFVLVPSCADRPSATGYCVMLRGDNEAAVHWVHRCRGGLELRSGALMRLVGVLEVLSGWHFEATHVCGSHNAAADGISRWDRGSVLDNLRAARPNIPWQVREPGTIGISLCTSWLATNSCDTPLRPRLNELI